METTWTEEYIRRLAKSDKVDLPRLTIFQTKDEMEEFIQVVRSRFPIVKMERLHERRLRFWCELDVLLEIVQIARNYRGDVVFPGAR